MAKKDDYQLTVGREEKSHLDGLQKVFGAASQKFLASLGIKPNAHIVDIGCGAGHMACWLAQTIVPHGAVVAIDSSAEQLEVAQEQAKSLGIKNISFAKASATDLSAYKEQFDLVYCRWMLAHIANVKLAFTQLVQCVTVGGMLACEEPTSANDSLVIYPEIPCLLQVFVYIRKLLQLKHADPLVGYTIYRLAQQMPKLEVQLQISQSAIIDKADYPKQLKILLMSVKPALLQNNIVSVNEINELAYQLDTIANPNDSVLLASRMMQLWAIKHSPIEPKAPNR